MSRTPLLLSVAGLALAGVVVPVPAAEAAPRLGDRVLRLQSAGADVRQLQRSLTQLDIPTSVDGRFGRGTRRSVRTYERAHAMRPDGRVSPRQGRGIARRAASSVDRSTTSLAPLSEVAGSVAVLSADRRRAHPPADAPDAVKAVIAAANEITSTPYRYGGGHGDFADTAYDCSGAVSYALHGAGLLDRPLASGALTSWGRRGAGRWITVYAHGGHAYAVIAGLRFDTSGAGERGPRWRPEARSARGFSVRHPDGL